MVRHLIPLVLLIILVVGGFWIALNTTILLTWYVPSFCRHELKDLDVKSFTIGRQALTLPETLTLYDVRLSGTFRGQALEVKAQKLVLRDVVTHQRKSQARVSLYGLSLDYAAVHVDDSEGQALFIFTQNAVSHAEGMWGAATVRLGNYAWQNAMARLRGNERHLQIFEIVADAYGGTVKGQVTVENIFRPQYVIWIEAAGMSSEALKAINAPLFASVQGKVNGTARLVGALKELSLLAVSADIHQGGSVAPSFLATIAAWSTQEEQKQQVLSLSHQAKPLTCEKISMAFHSANNYRLSTSYGLESAVAGLRFKASRDESIPSGLGNSVFKDF